MARKEVDSVSETATQTERAAVVLGQGQFTQHSYSTMLGYLHIKRCRLLRLAHMYTCEAKASANANTRIFTCPT